MDIHIDLEDRSHSKHTCVVADRRWPFRTPASMVECGLGASLAWVLVSPIAYRCCQAVLFRRLGQGLLPNSSRAALAASASSHVQCNASLMFAEEVDVHSCPQDTLNWSVLQNCPGLNGSTQSRSKPSVNVQCFLGRFCPRRIQ